MGSRQVFGIEFVSGRQVEVTADHQWVTRRKRGREAWQWTRAADLQAGDHVPMPLTADFGTSMGTESSGYFVGAMLGDGNMTNTTPEFHGDPDDGAVAFMRSYAAGLGCLVTERPSDKIVRLRITDPRHMKNAAIDVLREYNVWGLRCEVKQLPNRSFSREFWLGCLSGLIDTDGCVRKRVNNKGILHGSIELATVSGSLMRQVSDALLRLGIPNLLRVRRPRAGNSIGAGGRIIRSKRDLHVVEIDGAQALVRAAQLLTLQISYKAERLAELASILAACPGKKAGRSEQHGYDPGVVLDRVRTVEASGLKRCFAISVRPSGLVIANGLVTGAQ